MKEKVQLHWDYRIIRQADGFMKIHRVFYNVDGTVYGMDEDELVLEGFELEELAVDFETLSKAFLKPAIQLNPEGKISHNTTKVDSKKEAKVTKKKIKEEPIDTSKINPLLPESLKTLFIKS